MSGAAGVVKTAVVVLGLTSGGVYAMHMGDLSPTVGIASALLMMLAVVPVRSTAPSVLVAVTTFVLGLMMVLAANDSAVAAARVVRDVGWTQAALAVWLVYHAAATVSAERRSAGAFDEAARARWRDGNVRFAAELARRIPKGAIPHWVALVVETAWPEPRPAIAAELLEMAATGQAGEMIALRDRMEKKGGVGPSEARWELARSGCEVIAEARGADPREHFGGPAASRFVLAAAKAVTDDEAAARIFAALVLPAVAGALERQRAAE
ncbi:MAG TPA: hypothetical protein VGH28_06375 [Polyangiaceae bacterium]|jgi:hypothetical protein